MAQKENNIIPMILMRLLPKNGYPKVATTELQESGRIL